LRAARAQLCRKPRRLRNSRESKRRRGWRSLESQPISAERQFAGANQKKEAVLTGGARTASLLTRYNFLPLLLPLAGRLLGVQPLPRLACCTTNYCCSTNVTVTISSTAIAWPFKYDGSYFHVRTASMAA